MKFLAIASLFGILFQTAAFAEQGNLAITPKMLSFDYAQSEGDLSLDCVPTLEDALSQDWIVNCGSAKTSIRKYRVHLWVTMYERPVAPKQSYEVLYWISDLSPGAPVQANASSTTIWFNFVDATSLTTMDLRLGVENDTAALHMIIAPSAK